MTKRAALKRQARESGAFDGPDYGAHDAKVRRLPVSQGRGWSPHPSNDDRDQAYLKTLKPKSEGQAELLNASGAWIFWLPMQELVSGVKSLTQSGLILKPY